MKRILVFALVVLSVIPQGVSAAESDERAGKIRAALIYYLVKFVEFPADPTHSVAPLTICLFGQDNLNPYLKDIVSQKTAHGRPLVVLPMAAETGGAGSSCNVMYFGSGVSAEGMEAQRSPADGTLTICAVSTVSWGSCMIQIFEEKNKARLAIDTDQLDAVKLKVSSELLEVSVTKKAE